MTDLPQSMFFKSKLVSAHWDTWMYFYQDTFYLYYLITEHSPGEGFGVATSPDGVTWTDHGWAIRASDKMVKYLGTGAVWQPIDFDISHRFICNYSEWREDEAGQMTQNILFAWSEDLINWNKFGDEMMFQIDKRWYDVSGRWDCIYPLCKADGSYIGYWTATPKDHVGIGFGQSRDGIKWEALPAPQLIWDDIDIPQTMEAGAIEVFDGRYYAMTGIPSSFSIRTMIADQPSGAFKVASHNYGLMENSGVHKHTYFSRFLRTPEGILVNHHAIERSNNVNGRSICQFAPLKKAFIDEQDTLWLIYWKGNDRLKRNSSILTDSLLNISDGVIIEGTINLLGADWSGIYLDSGDGKGCGILVGEGGKTRFVIMTAKHRIIQIDDEIKREWVFGERVEFRVLAKDSLLEFYLDDIYIQSYSLYANMTGHIDIYDPNDVISDVVVWTVS